MKYFYSLLLFLAVTLKAPVHAQSGDCLEIVNLNPIDFIDESKGRYVHLFLVRSISDTIVINRVQTSGLQYASTPKKILLPGECDTIEIHSPLTGRVGKWNKTITVFTNKCTQDFYIRFTVLHPAGPIPYAVFDPSDEVCYDSMYANMNWYGIRIGDYPPKEPYTDMDGHTIDCKEFWESPSVEIFNEYEIRKINPVFNKKSNGCHSVSFPHQDIFKCVVGISKPLITAGKVYPRQDFLFEGGDSILNLNFNFEVDGVDTTVILKSSFSKTEMYYTIYYSKRDAYHKEEVTKEVIADNRDGSIINRNNYPVLYFVGNLDSDGQPDFIIKYEWWDKFYQLVLSSKLKELKNTKSFIYSRRNWWE